MQLSGCELAVNSCSHRRGSRRRRLCWKLQFLLQPVKCTDSKAMIPLPCPLHTAPRAANPQCPLYTAARAATPQCPLYTAARAAGPQGPGSPAEPSPHGRGRASRACLCPGRCQRSPTQPQDGDVCSQKGPHQPSSETPRVLKSQAENAAALQSTVSGQKDVADLPLPRD